MNVEFVIKVDIVIVVIVVIVVIIVVVVASVRPSVGPLRLCNNRVSRLFLATVRSYTESNDQPTCFESLFTRLFVHLSLHTCVA